MPHFSIIVEQDQVHAHYKKLEPTDELEKSLNKISEVVWLLSKNIFHARSTRDSCNYRAIDSSGIFSPNAIMEIDFNCFVILRIICCNWF